MEQSRLCDPLPKTQSNNAVFTYQQSVYLKPRDRTLPILIASNRELGHLLLVDAAISSPDLRSSSDTFLQCWHHLMCEVQAGIIFCDAIRHHRYFPWLLPISNLPEALNRKSQPVIPPLWYYDSGSTPSDSAKLQFGQTYLSQH